MAQPRLDRTIGHLNFQNPLVLGAGTCKTYEDIKYALNTAAGGIELGSITPLPRDGNGGKNFYAHTVGGVLLYTLNSLGMPNPGKDRVAEWAPDAIAEAHEKGKCIGINVAADTVEEIVMMILWALPLEFDWITINAGCPNKWKTISGKQVPESILSFNTKDIADLLDMLNAHVGSTPTEIWWKASPYNDTIGLQQQVFDLLVACGTISGVVLNNTVPHCFSFDRENGYADRNRTTAIDVGVGLAGMGGPAVRPKALGDLLALSGKYQDRFKWIVAGGITTGEDILDALLRDADLVQCTSVWWASGFDRNVPGNMLAGYCDIAGVELD